MKRFLVIGALLLCVAPSFASGAEYTFVVQNNHPYSVEIQIYTPIRHAAWPAWNRVWINRSSEPERYTISCAPGEKVCFGAASGRIYWGVGLRGRYGCAKCCRTCIDGEETEIINLN